MLPEEGTEYPNELTDAERIVSDGLEGSEARHTPHEPEHETEAERIISDGLE